MKVTAEIELPDLYSVLDMLAELDRELRLRGAVYPRYVAAGRMTQGQADGQIAVLRAVRTVLAQLPGAPRDMPPERRRLRGV